MTTYTSVDRILAKLYREIPSENFNESDVIEWIGEALEFLRVAEIQEEGVSILTVSDYQAKMPEGLVYILQIAKYNGDIKTNSNECGCSSSDEKELNYEQDNDVIDDSPDYRFIEQLCLSKTPVDGDSTPDYELVEKTCLSESPVIEYSCDCNEKKEECKCKDNHESKYEYKTTEYNFSPINYSDWTCCNLYNHFEPIRLSDNTFFNSIVCKEKNDIYSKPCYGHEYTIVGTTEKFLRFSFKEGTVAISYKKSACDKETGYPLVPDEISIITAITYYIKWKLAENYFWAGKAKSENTMVNMEQHWLKYARQAKNKAKMLKTIDQFQNHLERTHQLIPRLKRYYGFFGNMSKEQKIGFYGQ